MKVTGVLVLTYYIDVDEEVDTEDESVAINEASRRVVVGNSYRSDRKWSDGPYVEFLGEDDRSTHLGTLESLKKENDA